MAAPACNLSGPQFDGHASRRLRAVTRGVKPVLRTILAVGVALRLVLAFSTSGVNRATVPEYAWSVGGHSPGCRGARYLGARRHRRASPPVRRSGSAPRSRS